MKTLLGLILSFSILSSSPSVIAQELGSLRRGYEILYPAKSQTLALNPLPSGTYSVGSGGYFPTIDSAFNKLSIDGIAGTVNLELIDSLYAATSGALGFFLNGPIPGAGPNSRVTLRPKENKNVTLEGDGLGVINFVNTSYVTVDGVGLTGRTTLTVHCFLNILYGWNDGINVVDNSDHNVIQNVIVISDDYTRLGTGLACYALSGFSTPDSNLIQNNFVKRAILGIQIHTADASARATGNTIRGNMVGSETDNLIAWGIDVEGAENTTVEDNIIQNMRGSLRGIAKGINSYYGKGDTIRNNTVHTIIGMIGAAGIAVGGDVAVVGSTGYNNIVYNNMVSDVGYSSSPTYLICGIRVRKQINAKLYYNSVFLSGTGSVSGGSAALYIESASQGIDARNNILVNTRNESPYCASAIYDYDASNILTADYNDLYYEPTQYSCLVRIGSTKHNTLADWQATGKDLHSVSVMSPFLSNSDLHITNSVTTIADMAIPLEGITTDIDGDIRPHTGHPVPDIGADEFEHPRTVSVDEETGNPASFSLAQNYPNPFNPKTVVRSQLPVASSVNLVVYDVLGREIAVMVNERRAAGSYQDVLDGNGLASGVYFYRLIAGGFVQIRKMVLTK